MKQDVIVLKKSGLVFSKNRDFLVGIVTFNFDNDLIPKKGIPIYYDLEDMNPFPFKLFEREDGTFYIL